MLSETTRTAQGSQYYRELAVSPPSFCQGHWQTFTREAVKWNERTYRHCRVSSWIIDQPSTQNCQSRSFWQLGPNTLTEPQQTHRHVRCSQWRQINPLSLAINHHHPPTSHALLNRAAQSKRDFPLSSRTSSMISWKACWDLFSFLITVCCDGDANDISHRPKWCLYWLTIPKFSF